MPVGGKFTVFGLRLVVDVAPTAAREASSVTRELPRTVCVDEFLAVTVTVCWTGSLLGAAYKPFWLMVPTAGVTDQATLVPAVNPSTENCCAAEAAKLTLAGLTLVDVRVGNASNCTVALAILLRSAKLVAVIVTNESA